jgi:hypothetical protein
MSPADVRLIVQGLLRRGALVQFDRPDFAALDRFVARHPAEFADLAPLLEALRREEAACRRAQPDLTRQWGRLLADRALEADVRRGLAEGYRVRGLADDAFAARLEAGPLRFALFHLLGAIPFAGRWLRQLWGQARVRRHAARMLRSGAYLSRVFAARNAALLARWHRAGRTGEARTRWLWRHPWVLLAERGTLGLLPAGLHRALGDPARVAARVRDAFRFLLAFTRDPAFREGWFLATIEDGRSEGMLTAEEAALIAARVRDPFIVKYLKCLGVHFATLPVSEICFVLGAAAAAAWMLLTGHRWGEALALAGGMFAFLQVMPVSPGSLIRGGFVVYLMVRERNLRDYLVAAPVAFVKGVGYLAFPLQMTTSYPHLARFLAARWATGAVHAVPVFGEKGAWLEHAVFDAFFNLPQAAGRWLAPRLRGLLTAWMLLGIGLGALAFRLGRLDWRGKLGIEVVLAVVCLFVLPRALLYPVLSRRRGPPA